MVPGWQTFAYFYTIRDRASGEQIENCSFLCWALNLVSRIEAIAKSLDLPLIASDDFAHAYGGALKSLRRHQLRGHEAPHELFTPQIDYWRAVLLGLATG
jgi:hypothetical protein